MPSDQQVDLTLLRHGPTDWNEAGRIQGRTDRPLSGAGRVRVRDWRLPAALRDHRWVASPLARARETAALLGHGEADIVPELIEANWGDWEGETLGDLRARFGESMTSLEAQGLDFRPPNGESPRDLQVRLAPWLARTANAGKPCVAVTHKGVIRAIYALASGWDLRGKPPLKLRSDCAHTFHLAADGRPTVGRLNMDLLP